MTKKALATVAISLAVLLAPQAVYARTICTQSYGQALECYEEEEVVLGVTHEPVEAGIADHPLALASGFLLVSLGLTFISRKNKVSSSLFTK